MEQYTVKLNRPDGVSRRDMAAYIKEAIGCWGGSFRAPGGYDPADPGDPLFGGVKCTVTFTPPCSSEVKQVDEAELRSKIGNLLEPCWSPNWRKFIPPDQKGLTRYALECDIADRKADEIMKAIRPYLTPARAEQLAKVREALSRGITCAELLIKGGGALATELNEEDLPMMKDALAILDQIMQKDTRADSGMSTAEAIAFGDGYNKGYAAAEKDKSNG